MEAFGGGNNSVLIHTDYSTVYEADGILERPSFTNCPILPWMPRGIFRLDQRRMPMGNFISGYAAQNPTREDVAESFLMWLAVRQCNLHDPADR